MYVWKSFIKIDIYEAIKRFSTNEEVYLLNDSDDTGIIAFSIEEIEEHRNNDGIFGIEGTTHSDIPYVVCSNCGNSVSLKRDAEITLKDYAIIV